MLKIEGLHQKRKSQCNEYNDSLCHKLKGLGLCSVNIDQRPIQHVYNINQITDLFGSVCNMQI